VKLVFIRTLKAMLVFALLVVIGEIDEWTIEGVFKGLFIAVYVHAVGFALCTGIIFGLIGVYELIKKIRTRSKYNDGVNMGFRIEKLKSWYASVTKKQRNILWVSVILISAIPIVGWVFIAPWLIPLMLFLEYHRS
jgi:hypothetical protein